MFFDKIKLLKYSVLFLFIGISIFSAYHHEFWADEIQAYLIASMKLIKI